MAALAVAFLGFLVYRGVGRPAMAVVGIFVIGLGIGPLYPLSANFAVGSAADKRDLASVRLAIAFGVSLLLAPMALGTLADQVGLGPAHLVLPALIAVACCSFFIAEALQRRSAVHCCLSGAASGSLAALRGVPQHVHLGEVGVGGGAAVRGEPRLDGLEAAGELGVRGAERLLRLEVELAGEVGQDEQEVAELLRDAAVAASRASTSSAVSSSSLSSTAPASGQSKPTRAARSAA